MSTTYRIPAADLLAAKAVISDLGQNLLEKAAAHDEPIFDLHLVFNIGTIVAGPKEDLTTEFAADPMMYLLIEPPGGITYADLHDLLFGNKRANKAEELMRNTLLMLQLIQRGGETEAMRLTALTEDTFLLPLLQLAVAYTHAKDQQEITHVVKWVARSKR